MPDQYCHHCVICTLLSVNRPSHTSPIAAIPRTLIPWFDAVLANY